jgi:predicted nucleotidyltransferase
MTENKNSICDNVILSAICGSRGYGTDNPSSDFDIRGIGVYPKNMTLGYVERPEQESSTSVENGQVWDQIHYDLRKFMRLAAGCNPNILEIVFSPDKNLRICTSEGALLRFHKEKFLSKEAFKTYGGYAKGQLSKIKARKSSIEQGKKSVKLNLERAEAEIKFGYDTKYAMHLVRLMRTCEEILSGQGVIVHRPDAEELKAIRNGSWSLQKLEEWFEEMDAKLYVKAASSDLPDRTDEEFLNELCVQIQEEHWNRSKPFRVSLG